jgi:hypothetical protein
MVQWMDGHRTQEANHLCNILIVFDYCTIIYCIIMCYEQDHVMIMP